MVKQELQRALLLKDKRVSLPAIQLPADEITAEASWEAYLDSGADLLKDASVAFLLQERWLPAPWSDSDQQAMQELLEIRRLDNVWQLRGACAPAGSWLMDQLQFLLREQPSRALEGAAKAVKTEVVSPLEPLQLAPCSISKLWGREQWFTGIEARGVSRVGFAKNAVALPHALGLLPRSLLGKDVKSLAPILLKVLEPHPVEGWGDLYLEVHQQKWEVYLVLDVNQERWQQGRGELLCGISEEALQAGNEDAIRQQFIERIQDYEAIRRTIDEALEEDLAGSGGISAVSLRGRQQAQAKQPAEWLRQEKRIRATVEQLLQVHSLRRGDVVTLPPKTLHSLRGGMRVLEFQTPTYERLIAMSSQKVLTQNHWDTQAALQLANMTLPDKTVTSTRLGTDKLTAGDRLISDGSKNTQLADFPEFRVQHFILPAGQPASFLQPSTYQLLFVAHGQGNMHAKLPATHSTDKNPYPLEAGQAWLLPAQQPSFTFEAISPTLELVLAQPKLAPLASVPQI